MLHVVVCPHKRLRYMQIILVLRLLQQRLQQRPQRPPQQPTLANMAPQRPPNTYPGMPNSYPGMPLTPHPSSPFYFPNGPEPSAQALNQGKGQGIPMGGMLGGGGNPMQPQVMPMKPGTPGMPNSYPGVIPLTPQQPLKGRR